MSDQRHAGEQSSAQITRRQLSGARAISAALRAGKNPRLLLVRRNAEDPEILAIVDEARKVGIAVRYATANDLRRMSSVDPAHDILAMIGPDPDADERTVLAARGAAWLLVEANYPGNVGFAIRTAEVSGADGIFIDTDLVGRARHRARRASMHADRFLPVHWRPAKVVVGLARAAGKRIVAIEDSGTKAPWETGLTGSLLLVIGGEDKGISRELLDSCDDVIRIPMAGFVPSYNLHAAMAAVAVERLRQSAEGAI